MPMCFVWWRNNQMAGADGHAPIGQRRIRTSRDTLEIGQASNQTHVLRTLMLPMAFGASARTRDALVRKRAIIPQERAW